MRPNLLIIMADDMGHWALHCARKTDVFAPNLDRLAAVGIRFEKKFCVSLARATTEPAPKASPTTQLTHSLSKT